MALRYTNERERRVLAIVWRAAYLETDLWTPSADQTTATLNNVALDELLDRRLRVCERMAYNVSGIQAMLGLDDTANIPRDRWNLATATPTSGWFDGFRVRLFEYPFIPNYFKSVVGNTLGTAWFEQTGLAPGQGDPRLAYVPKPIATRSYTDGSVDLIQSVTAWRFPTSSAPHWQLSPGNDVGFGAATTPPLTGIVPKSYRIDLVPAAGATPASIIDGVFDYTSTDASGAPTRADFWNRAWLFCDHVIALINLEALLFGRRRRPNANAEGEFATLVGRRSTVTVRTSAVSTGTTNTVSTPFVCLDGQVPEAIPRDDQVIMSAQGTDPVTLGPLDANFDNSLIPVEDLQVGDHVIVVNAPIYRAFTQDGEWGVENAFVMDIDSTVNDVNNRGGVRRDEIQLQGHGTTQRSHKKYRELMKDVLVQPYAEMLTRLKAKLVGNPALDFESIQNTGIVLFRWLPFSDSPTNIVFNAGEAPVSSGPWWFAYRFTKDFSQADDAVQAFSKVVGGTLSRGTQPLPAIPNLPLSFDDSVLIPLFEPSLRGKAGSKIPWRTYLNNHPSGTNLVLRPVVVDSNMIPGLFLRGTKVNIGVVRPRIRVK